MVKQYAFYFDSSACSGCKSCQVACKDRHGLAVGQLWRRVYEVTGGEWVQAGPAWQPEVFAYQLSISCNHCQKPVCLEACPARAIIQRADGIVLIDEDRCLGCRYCAWACPYGALQFDEQRGVMTKCNFCVEDLEAGLPPACTAACPMRALEFGEREALQARPGVTSQVFPLPDPALTRPSLAVKPHPSVRRLHTTDAWVANREEVVGSSD